MGTSIVLSSVVRDRHVRYASYPGHYLDRISQSVINSGATVHTPPPRGTFPFQRLDDFDYEASYQNRGRAKAIAELAIDGGMTADAVASCICVTPSVKGELLIVD